MQSAAVPCTSNGIKRTAANALLSDNTSHSDSNHNNKTNNNNTSTHSNHLNNAMSSSDSPPPEKRSFIVIESPLKLETIASAEDLDVKVLRIQNKNLGDRLLQRQKLEKELRDKIEILQNKKVADDSKLCIMDRYWTQLDEDLRIILERFDSSPSTGPNTSSDPTDSSSRSSGKETNKNFNNSNTGNNNNNNNNNNKENNKSSSQSLRNFLFKLNDWDKVELEENLKERVKFTTQTVAKLITNYDRLSKKNEQNFKELIQLKNASPTQASSTSLDIKMQEVHAENCKLNETLTKCQQKIHTTGLEKKQLEDKIATLESEIKDLNTKNDETEYELETTRNKAFKLDRQLADSLVKLQKINNNFQTNNKNNHSEQNGHNSNSNNGNKSSVDKNYNITEKQLKELEAELEEQRELAGSRLQELEKLNVEYQQSVKMIERLKADLKSIPESIIEQTNEYKYLQTKYSLSINDNMKLKQALDETRSIMEMTRVQFQQKLDQMESDELAQQKKLGNEMMLLEEQLSQVRKENELLRIEYEQNVAANEQTGPINKEMRSLITTLQTNNKLVKSDIARTKKRLEECQTDLDRYKKQNVQLQAQIQQYKKELQHQQHNFDIKSEPVQNEAKQQISHHTKQEPSSQVSLTEQTKSADFEISINIKKEETDIPGSSPSSTSTSKSSIASTTTQHVSHHTKESKVESTISSKDLLIKELKEQVKKLQDNQKEMKHLLDKSNQKHNSPSSSSSSSSNSTSSSSSNKYKSELEDAKIEIKRLKDAYEKLKSSISSSNKSTIPNTHIPAINSSTASPSPSPSASSQHQTDDGHQSHTSSNNNNSNHHHHHHHGSNQNISSTSSSGATSSSSNEYSKKIRSLEEQVKDLYKSLSNKKQEEAALMNEMEITGQAFEDMQEQNIRLMQQLREKDDANFRLVSERIKLENVQKILKEEKEMYMQQVVTLQEQQEAQINISKKLDEQIALLTQAKTMLEKELLQLHQTTETYKRQAYDNVQLIQDLKLNTQKYSIQLKEAQQQLAEKSESLVAQSFTNKRCQEEIKHLQSKLERQKKFENASSIDEVLKEENREYKEQLRCPSCKVKQKDAVLTKCFHVFCFDCLQKRYDTRQRKCPKCNANFGANDFHKLYLS